MRVAAVGGKIAKVDRIRRLLPLFVPSKRLRLLIYARRRRRRQDRQGRPHQALAAFVRAV
jgi:hypothetical protein